MSIVPETYQQARRAFLAAAAKQQGRLTSYTLPGHLGYEGEELAVDVAAYGPRKGHVLFLVSSGVHGAEAFANSAAQTQAIKFNLMAGLPRDCGLLMVHGLNPHGFSHMRRVNEEGVDLNRNFIDWASDKRLPPMPAVSRRLWNKILKHNGRDADSWQVDNQLVAQMGRMGITEFTNALYTDQHDMPQAVCFAGQAPVWSNQVWHDVLGKQARGFDRIVHLDMHSGAGPDGGVVLLPSVWHAPDTYVRMRRWWGDQLSLPGQTQDTDLFSMSGSIDYSLPRALPGRELMHITSEIGTGLSSLTLLWNYIDDHRLHAHGGNSLPHAQEVRRNMRNCFAPRDTLWETRAVTSAVGVIRSTIGNIAQDWPKRVRVPVAGCK